jgi:hypothetical protein
MRSFWRGVGFTRVEEEELAEDRSEAPKSSLWEGTVPRVRLRCKGVVDIAKLNDT